MLRRRGRAWVCARRPWFWRPLAVAGCGRNDFKNDPRPPIPTEVTVKIATDGVAVSPKEFGAGLVNFTVANLTDQTGSLAINGPVDADSDQIQPGPPSTVKVDLKTGSYEASADGHRASGRQLHRRAASAPRARTTCCCPSRTSPLVAPGRLPRSATRSARARARTLSTISSSVARALSELVLMPVSVERIACACFRQCDRLLGGVADGGGVHGQSRSRAIATRAAASR